jgi:micrococcal nuclease
MARLVLALSLLLSVTAFAKHKKHDARGTIVLNGTKTAVHWSDGDSFKVSEGEFKGKGTRLVGYNTLEAYGPVHQWGEWTAEELFALAEASAPVAAAKEWTCTTDGKEDGYHRLLINCPDLAVEMVKTGYGMAYAVDGASSAAEVLAAQADAQANRRGMWKKGVVKGVITSLHSLGEDGDTDSQAYNRVVDTRTGQALKRAHQKTYKTCEMVCEETDGEKSCMVYVPFSNRYKKQPACLR